MSKVVCEHCAGSGRRAQGSYDDCDRCHGTGEFVSGSGEPVPAPTTHDAARLAAERVEREVEPMLQRLIDSHERIDFWDLGPTREAKQKAINDVARDIKLYVTNALIPQYQALGSARPPLPPQEISPPRVEVGDDVWQAAQDELIRVRFEESPPNPDNWFQGQVHPQELRDALNAAFARAAALRVRGEPSREPTLEEIAREAVAELERIRQSVHRRYPSSGLPGTVDYEVDTLMGRVLLTFAPLRARLSSPEAPR